MTAAAQQPPHAEEEQLPRMSFGDHLDELRRRLLIVVATIIGCIVVLLPFKTQVTAIYVQPYRQMWLLQYETYVQKLEDDAAAVAAAGGTLGTLEMETLKWNRDYHDSIRNGTFNPNEVHRIQFQGGFRLPYALVAIGGLEDFWIFMAASMLFSLILASPVVLYQAWAFVAAGLYRHERRVVQRILPLSIGLLVAGVLFGYFVVVPFGLYMLVQMMDWFQVAPMFSVAQYFSFLLTLTAALGLVFQLPMFMLALQKIGLATHAGMRRNWRYVILICFVIAAVLTPPDPFTQTMMAVPMVVLYGFGLLLTWLAEKRRNEAATAT